MFNTITEKIKHLLTNIVTALILNDFRIGQLKGCMKTKENYLKVAKYENTNTQVHAANSQLLDVP